MNCKRLIRLHRERSLPLHAVVLDVGWHLEENAAMATDCKGYGGYMLCTMQYMEHMCVELHVEFVCK